MTKKLDCNLSKDDDVTSWVMDYMEADGYENSGQPESDNVSDI